MGRLVVVSCAAFCRDVNDLWLRSLRVGTGRWHSCQAGAEQHAGEACVWVSRWSPLGCGGGKRCQRGLTKERRRCCLLKKTSSLAPGSSWGRGALGNVRRSSLSSLGLCCGPDQKLANSKSKNNFPGRCVEALVRCTGPDPLKTLSKECRVPSRADQSRARFSLPPTPRFFTIWQGGE